MESEFLGWLRSRLPTHPLLWLGPGDDGAVLGLADRSAVVVTSDLLSEGVDFEVGRVDPRRIGHKALAVNLSDLAAMAAEPLAVVISLLLPRNNALELARELYLGLLPSAEQYNVAIAGGDTNTWNGPLAISVTALGQTTAHGPLRRDGAKPGDVILVTGALGGSILGRHLDVVPRCREALLLHQAGVTAGLDCSDGLAKDLGRLCTASNLAAIITAESIPIHQDAERLAVKTGRLPLEHALSDGEDFELILSAPPPVASRLLAAQPLFDQFGRPTPLTKIGEFATGAGMQLRHPDGTLSPLAASGYEH